MLESLEKLDKNQIDIDKVSIIAKCAEAIISSVKTQLVYSQMKGHEPHIEFLDECHRGTPISADNNKKLVNIR